MAAVTITNCTFIGNGPTPATKGGPAGKPSYGGAVDVVGNRYSGSNPVRLAIRDCIFEGNTAESGGGVSSTQWGPFAGIAEIYNSVFKNNTVCGCVNWAECLWGWPVGGAVEHGSQPVLFCDPHSCS